MFLHLYILTHFGVHESSVAWLEPLSCLLLFKGKPLSFVSYIKPSSICYHHHLYCFDPMLKIFLKKQSFLSRFVSTNVGHLIPYISTGLFLSNSTLCLGGRHRNTSMHWYLQTSCMFNMNAYIRMYQSMLLQQSRNQDLG